MNDNEFIEVNELREEKEDSLLKGILLTIFVIVVGGGLAFGVVTLTPQSCNCEEQIENATNATMIEAYPLCLEYMQELVLDYKVLPVLLEDGNVTYLNLTEYYDLNDLGGNK